MGLQETNSGEFFSIYSTFADIIFYLEISYNDDGLSKDDDDSSVSEDSVLDNDEHNRRQQRWEEGGLVVCPPPSTGMSIAAYNPEPSYLNTQCQSNIGHIRHAATPPSSTSSALHQHEMHGHVTPFTLLTSDPWTRTLFAFCPSSTLLE